MTNLQRIRKMPSIELAEKLIKISIENGQGYTNKCFECSDGYTFTSWGENEKETLQKAICHEVKWLSSEVGGIA
jgi:hypothetical protein